FLPGFWYDKAAAAADGASWRAWAEPLDRVGPETLSVMRLLIIEDDCDAADYLIKAFREVGHVADKALDGEEGLALALEGQHDVLIIDRMLPKRDGLAVIGTLRSQRI